MGLNHISPVYTKEEASFNPNASPMANAALIIGSEFA